MTGKELITVIFICLIGIGQGVFAQNPTDLYQFRLHKSGDHKYHLFGAHWLSGFNRGGYTNQPWFTPNGDVLVSVRKSGEKQNEIYRLNLRTRRIKQITETASNEYSPRIQPDDMNYSVLRQVEGEPIDQQIFTFPISGGEYKSVMTDIKDIGYYTWLSEKELGLFRIEGETNRLVYQNLVENKTRRITSSIGRTLLTDNNGSIVYVHKFATDYWYIKKYNPASTLVDIVVETPGLNEDFTIAPDGTYFIGNASKLFYFHPDHHTKWQEMGDLSIYGISKISRLSVSPDGDQLVLVSTRED
jgi:Tol biopolymer transport system component